MRYLISAFIVLLSINQSVMTLEEVRAVWVPAWELTSPEKIEEVVDDVASAHFNLIFAEVRYRADCLYTPNRIYDEFPNFEPRSTFLENSPTEFDPLEFILEYAHKKGIRVHAWVTTFVATRKDFKESELPFPSEWFTLNEAGSPYDESRQCWLDPALPQVWNYLIGIFSDIVMNYPVDGFHLDYLRYPSDGFGHNPSADYIFTEETGFEPKKNKDMFRVWRAGRITKFLGELEQSLHRIRPDLPISAAVIGGTVGAYEEFGQRWGEWLSSGLVDFVVPMCYADNIDSIEGRLEEYKRVADEKRVIVGIGVLERGNGRVDTVEQVTERIKSIRARGFNGYSVFSHETLTKCDEGVFGMLSEGVNNLVVDVPDLRVIAMERLPVVAISHGGERYYSIRYDIKSTQRYAILKAKELQYETDNKAFIKLEDGWYNIYIGLFNKKGEAERLAGLIKR
ncbi:MAG: hypothetical protein DRH49_03895 [Candidatus Coatesbacteria bacterium]|nr:MAG: hypothetical protein DRH49_03895 [Candidatus Coatesbacteria bacterium]